MRDARVTLFFFERDVDFRLAIGELRRLEEIRLQNLKKASLAVTPEEASLGRIFLRLANQTALLDDIHQVLRLGMVGAGMKPQEAFDLVERHLQGGQILECGRIAQAVLGVALTGPEDERLGETRGAKRKPAASRGPRSTGRAPTSASPRDKSTK